MVDRWDVTGPMGVGRGDVIERIRTDHRDVTVK